MRSIVPAFLCLAALSSCSGGNGNLRKVAMADLGCPSRQLEIEQISRDRKATSYLVSGCGRSAQYSVSKKSPPLRTSEIVNVPVAVAAAPPPAAGPTPEEQQRLAAFMQEHQQRMDGTNQRQQEFFKSSPTTAPPPQRPAPIAEDSAPAPAPPAVSQSNPGWVCLGTYYYACPDTASTIALGAYGACQVKCMMDDHCGACVAGAGERCVRDTARDSSCK